MKHWLILLFISVCPVLLPAQNITLGKTTRKQWLAVDTQQIRAHVTFLADDRLKGRLPGTPGFLEAVEYVEDQFRKLGVQPGVNGTSFRQELIIRKSVVVNSSFQAVLSDGDGNTDTLELAKDLSPQPDPLHGEVATAAQLAFAGYGVEIPGGYSDYAGLDVKEKIVVIISGAPEGLHSTLTAHFSSPGTKLKTAVAKGAWGVILINLNPRPGPANPNPVYQTNVALNPEKTAAYGRSHTGELGVVLNSNKAFLSRLLLRSGHSLNQLLASLRKGQASSFDLGLHLSVKFNSTYTDIPSQNVVGLIPGSDPGLKSEYVVHTAHLDHIGIGRPVRGDSIYNGAHDNASGVASLLEIARIYITGKARPKRSVMIVMVTGEEMGLIGSAYYAANPPLKTGRIIANVNTDMPTVIAPILSIVPLGAEHSSLMNQVQAAARYMKLEVEKDPEPSENRFVRSDQYSFVVQGIPALHIKYGNKTDIPGFDLGAFVKEWRAKYYHQAADGMDGIFLWSAAKTYVQLNFLISYSVAQAATKPGWNKGDLFGLTHLE